MKLDPISIALIILGIAAFATAGIIFLIKMEKVKKYLTNAEEAIKQGDDKTAIVMIKGALNNANEKPDLEASILTKLEALYKKNGLGYDFSDFNKLTGQFQVLKKKSSNKARRELYKVINLKKEMVKKMPELP
jgi:hypothetical protein